jgi:hypothetical protein
LEQTLEVIEATSAALEATNVALEATLMRIEAPTDADVPLVVATSTLEASTTIPMPTETIPPSAFPTPRIELVSVVEQVFEGGRMFWFRETQTIWVLVGDEIDPEQGEWLCFTDTFVEGDVESLPTFEPNRTTTESSFANALVQQPIRGFGKIWRDNQDIREKLGFALASEIEHSGRRQYIAGGVLDASNQYIPAPGEWRTHSFYGETLILFEDELNSECPSGRWRLRRP